MEHSKDWGDAPRWVCHSQRVSRDEIDRITPSLDVIARITQGLNVSIDNLIIKGIPRRPVRAAEHNLGDCRAALDELPGDDPAALPQMLDALIAKNRPKLLAETIC